MKTLLLAIKRVGKKLMIWTRVLIQLLLQLFPTVKLPEMVERAVELVLMELERAGFLTARNSQEQG